MQRIDNEHMRGGRIVFSFGVINDLRSALQLVERRCQPQRMTADFSTCAVGGIFAGARDRHLDQHGGNRCQDHNQDGADQPERVVAVAAEEHRKGRQHGNRPGDGRGDGHDQRVAVFHMGQFMRHDTGDLLRRQDAQQAAGRRHRCVFRITPRRKRVGLVRIDDIDLRHRQASTIGKLFDRAVKPRRRARIDFGRAVHRQHHPVGIPVGEHVHAHCDGKGDQHAGRPAEHKADADEQGRHPGEKNGCLQVVHVIPTLRPLCKARCQSAPKRMAQALSGVNIPPVQGRVLARHGLAKPQTRPILDI